MRVHLPGAIDRAGPATPIASTPACCATCAGVGGSRNKRVGTPASASASITSVEPVKSSP
jgi:hypothetical protein